MKKQTVFFKCVKSESYKLDDFIKLLQEQKKLARKRKLKDLTLEFEEEWDYDYCSYYMKIEGTTK